MYTIKNASAIDYLSRISAKLSKAKNVFETSNPEIEFCKKGILGKKLKAALGGENSDYDEFTPLYNYVYSENGIELPMEEIETRAQDILKQIKELLSLTEETIKDIEERN